MFLIYLLVFLPMLFFFFFFSFSPFDIGNSSLFLSLFSSLFRENRFNKKWENTFLPGDFKSTKDRNGPSEEKWEAYILLNWYIGLRELRTYTHTSRTRLRFQMIDRNGILQKLKIDVTSLFILQIYRSTDNTLTQTHAKKYNTISHKKKIVFPSLPLYMLYFLSGLDLLLYSIFIFVPV